jgi:hypothetical protein
MLNKADVKSRIVFTKNLISDQTYNGVNEKMNTSDLAFDAVEGLGSDNGSSTAVTINVGGFDDQKIIAALKYVSPTTAGNEDIGVMLRLQTMDSPDATYYYARVDGGNAKITKIIDGAFTTLTSSAFALTQDTVVTITFSVVGSQLTALFQATGGSPSDVTLSTSDSSIPSGGMFGYRSLNSTVYCRSFTVEQL